MPDFHQPGPVISLPLLGGDEALHLEDDLQEWTRALPLALLLPCHIRDLGSPALSGIIGTLKGVPWASRIVVGLDGADGAQFAAARRRFRALGPRCDVLWHDSPGQQEHWRMLGGAALVQGKGRNLWAAARHVLSDGGIHAVAMHDCDILTYSRSFLARLCWPVLHPTAGLRACKGYYTRSAGRLHGRVFRLMFQPLLRAWRDMFPLQPWPAFLQSLRYPLSGELCVEAALLRQLPFDPGWGVEVRLLYGLFHAAGPRAICQSELCAAYDHKHQEPADLQRMAGEVAHTFWMTLHEENAVPPTIDWAALWASRECCTTEAVLESALMSRMNGMARDGAAEAALAAQLSGAVRASIPREQGGNNLLPPPAGEFLNFEG